MSNANSKRLAVIARSYAKTVDQVDEVAKRALSMIGRALQCGNVAHVIIAIPSDKDCGATRRKVVQGVLDMYHQPMEHRISVVQIPGNENTEVLNAAVMKAYDIGNADIAVIVSNKAAGHITPEVMARVNDAFDLGTCVVGVRIRELDEVHECPIENTFAAWDIQAFVDVGGFKNPLGVEEIFPLVQMIRTHGVCAKLIDGALGVKLEIRQSADGAVRHREVKETKRMRQETEAVRTGVSLSWINQNIRDFTKVIA